MAKKETPKFIKSPSAKGDLWVNGRCYKLNSELTQKELKELFELNFTNLVTKNG